MIIVLKSYKFLILLLNIEGSFNKRTGKEDIQKSLIKQMRVFMMIPSDEFVLKTGDIAYWIGHVPAKAVEKYIKQSRYENYIIYSSQNENLESKSGRAQSVPIVVSKY